MTKRDKETAMHLKRLIDELSRKGPKVLSEIQSKEILECVGIPTTGGIVVASEEEAIDAARKMGYPVALKVQSPDITHKSDVGGVKIGLNTEALVSDAYRKIMGTVGEKNPTARIEGVVVQKMALPGVETIIGTTVDKTFGPMIMFGMGGIFAELTKDISLRVIPIGYGDAKAMIQEIKGFRLLNGFRGAEKADIESLSAVLMKVSALVWKYPEILEMDINPIVATPTGAVAVDARIVLTD